MIWKFAMAFALFALAACGGANQVPKGGIVSNNPCIDAVLAEIAEPGDIAAVSAYSHDPQSASAPVAWARKLPAIGTSAEEILAARPRLLLTGNFATGGTQKALAQIGAKSLRLGVPASVEQSKQQVQQIARAIGRKRAGARLLNKIDIATSGPEPDHRPTAIIWQNGGFVPGAGTLQDELLARAGYKNASANFGLAAWEQLPLETLIRNPPDVIFMPSSDVGAAGRELVMRRKLLKHLGSKTRLANFPNKLLFCGGPSIIKVMERLRAANTEADKP
ncbi:MAG: ABC transporter substrate-binding protein [Sphingorhabdus sp.]